MRRHRVPELMDQPGIDPAAHRHALRSLNRVNGWLGVNRTLLRLARTVGGPDWKSLADLGAGGGGFLADAARLTEPDPRRLLVGIDCSHAALCYARQRYGPALTGVVADARRLPLADASVDVAVCSLFLHHFAEPDAVIILREAARICRRGIVVGDLSRSRWALAATWLVPRLISRSRVFHVDGVRSVRAAFRADELTALAQAAGLVGAQVTTRFPFRIVLVWRKPEGLA